MLVLVGVGVLLGMVMVVRKMMGMSRAGRMRGQQQGSRP